MKSGLLSTGEAKRNDKDFSYASAWQFQGDKKDPLLRREWLDFEFLKPSTRSYK